MIRTLITIYLLSMLPQPSFRHIGIDEGLSQLSVQAIEEDSNGFIWVGTGDGLNKLEGDNITIYRHAYQDSTSIIDDNIDLLESTIDGGMLAVSKKGISHYMPETDKFRTISGTEKTHRCFDLRKCPSLIQNPGNWLLLSRRNLMTAINPATGAADTLSSNLYARHFLVTDSTLYILTATAEVYKVTESFKNIQRVFSPKFKCGAANMCLDKKGNIWIGLTDNGIISLNPINGSHKHYTTADGLSSNLVRAVESDDSGIIWIATGNNLTLLNPEDGGITICTHNNLEPESLSSASLKAMFKSSSGAMWIGTYYKGIDYYNPDMLSFHNIVLPESYWDNSEAIICSISADPDGFLWVGTSRSGIFRYNPTTSRFTPFKKSLSKEKTLNAVAYHKNGQIVLFGCSYSGLSIYDKSSDRIIWQSNNGSVFSIAKHTDKTFLIGQQHGIKVFDFKDMSMKNVSIADYDKSRVYCLFTDSQGNVWAGLEDMLYTGALSKDTADGYIYEIKNIYHDICQVQDIVETDKKLWFASRSGVHCYDKDTEKWQTISAKDGISTNLIRGLEIDDIGYIWASTDRGILLINQETLSFEEYHKKDGLVNEKYNIYANCKTEDGTLWFGGTSGITHFTPQEKNLHNKPNTPFISELYVNGERCLSGNSDILSAPIHNSTEIHLKAGQNNISLKMANLDFCSKDRIEYIMEGIDRNWQCLSNNSSTVSYTNLPVGSNIFKVRSVNILTGTESETVSMTIHIKCHWYQSTGFIVVICLLILLGILQFIHHVKKQSSHKIEEILNKAQSDIRTAKTSSYLTIQNMNRKRDIDFMAKALKVVEENVSNDKFNIDIFAEEMHMSRSNLHIRIKSAYGASATHFIRRIRIEKAMELLQEGKMNISEIAYSVGFSSATYFATAFKQVTGVNPTEWKQSLQHESSKENK